MDKKILILVPGEKAQGGITNYYYSIKNEFTHSVEYFTRGSRTSPFRESLIKDILQPIKDYFNFWLKVRNNEFCLLQTTTAFDKVSIIRDTVFILLAKFYNMKVIVFFHGWDIPFAEKLERKHLNLFKKIYFNKVDAVIDLSSEFVSKMKSWGFKKKIYLETTLVEKDLVKDLTEEIITSKFKNTGTIEILFLSRIEESKGIYKAIDAYKMLNEKYDCRLTIAGDGKEMQSVKNYVQKENVSGITFFGHVSGKKKIDCFMASHIYLFPSYWREGMPISVLEAMAFGLPVVTRRVGGLIDFFENDVHGFFTDSKDPKIFFEFMDSLLSDKDKMLKIALHNYRYAGEKFLAPQVAKRIDNIFSEVLEN